MTRVLFSSGKLRFGRFKRRTPKQLPDHYVFFLLRHNSDLPDDLVRALVAELYERADGLFRRYVGAILLPLPVEYRAGGQSD